MRARQGVSGREEAEMKENDVIRERIIEIRKMFGEILLQDRERALALATEAMELAGSLGDRQLIAISLMQIGDCYRRMENFQLALEYLTEALDLFEQIGELSADRAQTAFFIGNIHYAFADYRQALEFYERAAALARKGNYAIWLAAALSSIGDTYRFLGDYSRAIDVLSEALKVWEEIGNKGGAAVAWNNIGIVHCAMNDEESGARAYQKSLELYREAGSRHGEALALSNLARTCVERDFERGLAYFMEALAIHRQLDNRRNEAGTLDHIGEAYQVTGRLDQALEYHRQALAMYESIGFESGRAEVLGRIGRLYLRKGMVEQAFPYLEGASKLASEIGYRMVEFETYRGLAEAYEYSGDPAKSLEYFKRYLALRDEFKSEETKKTIAAMQMRIDVERAEKEKEIYRLKASQLEEDMERKSRELAAMALHLAQKSELISDLKQQVAPFARSASVDARELAKNLLHRISEDQGSEGEWQRFERQFQEVHPGFMQRMIDHYPMLTPSELRVCALLRINLSTKEIADLLGGTVRTVEKHRQHIRKKIGIANAVNLTTFLASV